MSNIAQLVEQLRHHEHGRAALRRQLRSNAAYRHCAELKAHEGCVNALELSRCGALLVSGGDDRSCLLWPLGGDYTRIAPRRRFSGHNANVFCALLSDDSRRIVSCGMDGLILVFDTEASPLLRRNEHGPTSVLAGHDDGVMKVSQCPSNNEILLSASLDGKVKLWDVRARDACQAEIGMRNEVNCVQFSPVASHLFATSGSRGDFNLWDLRMGCSTRKKLHVMAYSTRLRKGTQKSRPPEVSSVVFHPSGSYICAGIQRHLPTMYAVDDQAPLLSFAADGFRNDCTIKSPCFAWDGEYFAFGSDNFSAYVWKLPDLEHAREMRKVHTGDFPTDDRIVFATSDGLQRIEPFLVDREYARLQRHRSIVNSVLAHPTQPLLFTAGVEKLVRVHSPYPISSTSDEPIRDRAVERGLHYTGPRNPADEDMDTLVYFDMLERHADPLWGSPGQESASSSTTSDEDDDDDDEEPPLWSMSEDDGRAMDSSDREDGDDRRKRPRLERDTAL